MHAPKERKVICSSFLRPFFMKLIKFIRKKEKRRKKVRSVLHLSLDWIKGKFEIIKKVSPLSGLVSVQLSFVN